MTKPAVNKPTPNLFKGVSTPKVPLRVVEKFDARDDKDEAHSPYKSEVAHDVEEMWDNVPI
ncbi:MAG: hypothetical protein AAF718_08745 [Pseudomonadota bacterium]